MDEKKNTITINGTDYAVKPGMKAIIIFENVTDKPFQIKNTTDMLMYYYSALLAGNPGMKLGFDELVDAVDDDPELLNRLSEIVMKPSAAEKVVRLENEGGPEPKKG